MGCDFAFRLFFFFFEVIIGVLFSGIAVYGEILRLFGCLVDILGGVP
jgi:hypothetical protein